MRRIRPTDATRAALVLVLCGAAFTACGGGNDTTATSAGGAGSAQSSTGSSDHTGSGATGSTSGSGGASQATGETSSSTTGGSDAGGAGTGGTNGGGMTGSSNAPAHRFRGLVDRGGDAAHGGMGIAPATPAWFRQVVNGGVMNVHWADLQPSQADNTANRIASTTGAATGTSYIDQYLAQYRAAIPAADREIKLRLFCGSDSPDWVKTKFGSVTWMNLSSPVPQWWDGASANFDFTSSTLPAGGVAVHYLQAYAKLIEAISDTYLDPSSAKYAPEIVDITISGTMTVFAEPCIRQAADGGPAAMHSAGLSATADQNSQLDVIQIHEHYVTRITSSMAFDPLQGVDSTFTGVAGAVQIMDMVRSVLGNRGVLANNSISCNDVPMMLSMGMEQPQMVFKHGGQGSTYETMYADMKDRSYLGTMPTQGGFHGASPIGFQTAASGNNAGRYPTSKDEILNMLDRARFFGGEYVELANNWQNDTNVTGQQAEVTARDTALEMAGPPLGP